MADREQETFNYIYSAKEQEEIKNIRNKYVHTKQQEDKMTQLRRLDQSVSQKASVVALIFGIIGTLILGLGMSLTMTDLLELFGSYQSVGMLIGILVGLVGILLVCFAYPVYNCVLRREREKIAPDIIRLTDELMK